MSHLAFGTYNLEFGGIDNGDDRRLRLQLEMLSAANADVWAFQECSDWQAGRSTTQGMVEDALGMRGFFARSNRGPGGDTAVFIRESSGISMVRPWHDEFPYTDYWHCVAHIVCHLEGFGPIRFASAHLAPASPEKRAAEAESFQLIAEKNQYGPLIAGGDWNAIPIGDPEPSPSAEMHPGQARRKIDTRAAYALSEYMTDIAFALGDKTPTVGHRRNGEFGYRCDRVYTTLPRETIKGFRVIQETNPHSDHLAAVGEFELIAHVNA